MVSFDIFDTLITRKTLLPVGTFLIMQRRIEKMGLGLGRQFVDNFPSLRLSAENSARLLARSSGDEEVDLVGIYNELAKMTEISQEMAEELQKIEIEAEIDNILPCIHNIRLLKRYYEKGAKVVLISDMYLNSTILRKMLVTIDSVFEKIPIYVSCEYGKTKASGRIYRIVKEVENIDCKKWIHYGDNSISDVSMPELMGIDTRFCKSVGLEEWEREIAAKCNIRWNLDLQVYLGISRYIRQSKRLSTNTQIGASIGGMALYPYVEWIIRKCEELGINRLYFIARDGYVIKAMADKVINNYQLDIKTTYFYGSRVAWNIDGADKSKKALIRRYFKQEIDSSDDKFAFVDVQGTGRTFDHFCEIMEGFINGPIKIFYYDFMNNAELSNCKVYTLFTNEKCAMCESLCRAPHDLTIGYQAIKGKIAPVLNSADQKKWKKCGVEDFVKGAAIFADYMSKNVWETEINIENQQLAIETMDYLSDKPCEAVLSYFASIPHGDVSDEAHGIYAPKLTYMDILKIFLYRTDEDIRLFYKGTNLEYSIKRLNGTERKLLDWCRKVKFQVPGIIIYRLKTHSHKGRHVKQKRLPKIIIYGAGENGRKLYNQLASVDLKCIVAWVDVNSSTYQEQGYPVKPVKYIFQAEYDYLVLTMKSQNSIENVKYMVLQAGLPKEKIMSVDEYYMDILNNKGMEDQYRV